MLITTASRSLLPLGHYLWWQQHNTMLATTTSRSLPLSVTAKYYASHYYLSVITFGKRSINICSTLLPLGHYLWWQQHNSRIRPAEEGCQLLFLGGRGSEIGGLGGSQTSPAQLWSAFGVSFNSAASCSSQQALCKLLARLLTSFVRIFSISFAGNLPNNLSTTSSRTFNFAAIYVSATVVLQQKVVGVFLRCGSGFLIKAK